MRPFTARQKQQITKKLPIALEFLYMPKQYKGIHCRNIEQFDELIKFKSVSTDLSNQKQKKSQKLSFTNIVFHIRRKNHSSLSKQPQISSSKKCSNLKIKQKQTVYAQDDLLKRAIPLSYRSNILQFQNIQKDHAIQYYSKSNTKNQFRTLCYPRAVDSVKDNIKTRKRLLSAPLNSQRNRGSKAKLEDGISPWATNFQEII